MGGSLTLILLIVALAGSALVEPGASQPIMDSIESDWRALVALYQVTGGDGWTNSTNWSVSTNTVPSPDDISQWYGVTVENGRVIGLSLRNNNLAGLLPSDLEGLTQLRTLNLFGNQLMGNIPSEVGKLQSLTHLFLSYNQFSGSIPRELGDLSNLQQLSLRQNILEGQIPEELGNLEQLTSLWLDGNGLSDTLPSAFAQLVNLEILDLGDNALLVGPMPESLVAQLPEDGLSIDGTDLCFSSENSVNVPYACVYQSDWNALTTLYDSMGGNQWINNTNWKVGVRLPVVSVSAWHGVTLENGRVTALRLGYNGLSGFLPPELGGLSMLEVLDLSFNPLHATLPDTLQALSSLQELNLEGTSICASSAEVLQWAEGVSNGLEFPVICGESPSQSPSLPGWFWGLIFFLSSSIAAVTAFAVIVMRKENSGGNDAVRPRKSWPTESILKSFDSNVKNHVETLRQDYQSMITKLSESNSMLGRELDSKNAEVKKLQIGYDNKVFRKFIYRFIQIDQALDYFIGRGTVSRENFEQIQRLLRGAFTECNVEEFTPELGSDYRYAFGVTEYPETMNTQNPADDYKIAQVLSVGYALRKNEGREVIEPAKVVIFRYK